MKPAVRNIFTDFSQSDDGKEELRTLFENTSVKIERIVSHDHSSPPGFWYDQDGDEWVIVLRGEATLEFVGGDSVKLGAGDYLEIPRRIKHRVARTGEETVWLAVHAR